MCFLPSVFDLRNMTIVEGARGSAFEDADEKFDLWAATVACVVWAFARENLGRGAG